MDYGTSSSGTDDDLPPRTSRMQREGRDSGNGRAVVQNAQYGRPHNNMESLIHSLEKKAYTALLRAFKAQADAITWEKESFISNLRSELRVSDEEHRELLSKVNSDDVLRQIREWRHSGSNQPGFISNAISAPGPTPSPTVSASQKKQKNAHLISKFHRQPSNLRNSPVPSSSGPFAASWRDADSAGVRSKISKVNVLQTAKIPQVPASGRDSIGHKRPPGRPPGKNRTRVVQNVDPLVGCKVWTRWPQDNNFYEAFIKEYHLEDGKHKLVYDMNTQRETFEWVDLKEISPSDIKWDGPVPEGYAVGGLRNPGGVVGRSSGTRGVPKGQSIMDSRHLQNVRVGLRDIELRQTDKVIREAEKVFAVHYPDPAEVERAKQLLREHELSLHEAILRLSEVSDGESEDGRNPPSSRTHSADHVRMRSRQNDRNEHVYGDEYTYGDRGGQGSDGDAYVGEYGVGEYGVVAIDDMHDGDEYG